MRRILFLTATLASLLMVFSMTAQAQNANNTTQTANSSGAGGNTNANRKRGPVFRATKDQVMQAQAILKQRGFYTGEQTGKLDTNTREGLKKYQTAEGLKVTGTLNKITLEKMSIQLTDKQRAM